MKKKYGLLVFSSALLLTACGNNDDAGNMESSANGANNEGQENNSTNESGNNEESISLNFATPDPESASITVAALEFAELVEERSNGSIQINVHSDGSLYGGDASAAINQLGDGSLDVLALSSTVYANSVPEFNMFSVPYLFDNQDQYIDFINDDLSLQLLDEIENLGIKGINYWPRSFRQITNSSNPINVPSDLEGLQLRVPNNPLWVAFFEEAGASPTPMDFSEVYNALQLGTIDGQENPLEIPVSSSFYEVQDYLSLTNHMADAWVFAFNNDVYDNLSDENQEIIDSTAEEMQNWLREYDQSEEESMLETLENEGMEINEVSEENQEEFVEISQSQYSEFRNVVENDEYFDETLEFVGKD